MNYFNWGGSSCDFVLQGFFSDGFATNRIRAVVPRLAEKDN